MAAPEFCIDDRTGCPSVASMIKAQKGVLGSMVSFLVDRDGNPFELLVTDTVTFKARQDWGSPDDVYNFPCTIDDAATGQVSFNWLSTDVETAGIYVAAFVVDRDVDAVMERVLFQPMYFEVAPAFGTEEIFFGVTMADIRMYMKDMCAADNFLLDAVEFSDDEIAFCMKRPLQQWNSTPPLLRDQYYTTPQSFPWPYHYVEAVASELLMIAVRNSERNSLRYSAGGVSIDDKAQIRSYLPLAQELRARWEQWMRHMKVSINMRRGFGTISIPSFGSWRS